MLAYQTVCYYGLKRVGVRNLEELLFKVQTFYIQFCNIMIIMCYEGNTDEKRVIISVNKMIE